MPPHTCTQTFPKCPPAAISSQAARASSKAKVRSTVSPGYFKTLRIERVAGEWCRLPPDARATPEVMVNRSFADRDAYEQNRLRTRLLVLFAATALFLACLGLYGTLSYAVSLRRREVGLRLALGALPGEIIRQIVGQCLRVVGLACLCGLALAVASTRVLSGMLYGVSPSDPVTLAGVLGPGGRPSISVFEEPGGSESLPSNRSRTWASRCRLSAARGRLPADPGGKPGTSAGLPPCSAGARPERAAIRPASAGLPLTPAVLRQPPAEDRRLLPGPGRPWPTIGIRWRISGDSSGEQPVRRAFPWRAVGKRRRPGSAGPGDSDRQEPSDHREGWSSFLRRDLD